MKNKYLKGFIVVALPLITMVISCSDRPSNVLDEKSMVSLLADMEIAEAYSNIQATSSKERNELGRRVMKAHGVSEEQLDTTLAWYGRNLDEYSALFEKVDKEILNKKGKYSDTPIGIVQLSDNLWPYNTHQIISPLSGYDSFIFSLEDPDIGKGDIVNLSFSIPVQTGIKGVLGVDYEGGGGDIFTSTINNKRKIELSLQTDSSRKVSRLFGVMSPRDPNMLPLYIDSVSITTEMFDTLTYRSKRHSLKSFGIIRPQIKEKKSEVKDSTGNINSSLQVQESNLEDENNSVLPRKRKTIQPTPVQNSKTQRIRKSN